MLPLCLECQRSPRVAFIQPHGTCPAAVCDCELPCHFREAADSPGSFLQELRVSDREKNNRHRRWGGTGWGHSLLKKAPS